MKKKLFLIALVFCFVLLSLTAKNANQYVSAFLGGKSATYGIGSYYTPAYGVVYTGYLWGEAGDEDSGFQARSGGSLNTYTPQRYVPSSSASAFSSRGASAEEQPFNTIGLNGRFEYTNATENYYSGSSWNGDYYSDFHSNYAFAFGAAFRQKIIDNLFAYENCGIEGGPYLLGLYGDFGITYEWYFSVSFGAKVSLGYNFYSASFDYPLMAPYIGIGYAF